MMPAFAPGHRRLAIALLGSLAATPLFAADPQLKPGRDPGGTAVAVLADGFDYTKPELARVLARDGEGEAIAFDAVDGDHRPFAPASTGTKTASTAASLGGVRIIAVRFAPKDRASLAKAIAFAAGTPARIALIPLDAETRGEIEVLRAAAARFKNMLFVASAPGLTGEERATNDTVENLVLLDSAGRNDAAAEAAARALGCGNGDRAGATGGERKRSFLDRAGSGGEPGNAPPGTDCKSAKPQQSEQR